MSGYNQAPAHEFDDLRAQRWEYFARNASKLVEEARYTANAGISYRGFKVGGVALAYYEGLQTAPYWGANTTRVRGDAPYCAEMKLIDDAEKVMNENPDMPRFNLYSMVVSGPAQPDDVSGLESPTLHCCAHCRARLMNSIQDNGPVSNDTVLLFAHPTMSVFEIYTPREVVELHVAAKSKMQPELAQLSLRVYGNLPEALHNFGLLHQEITGV